MILQALHELNDAEGLTGDPDFESVQIAWLVRVGRDGKLLGIEGTHQEPHAPARGRTRRPVPKRFSVPRREARTSGDSAMFFYDKAEYVFGIDPSGQRKADKLAARFALFRDRVRRCVRETADEGATAILTSLDDIAAGRETLSLPDDCAANDLFAFVYGPDVDMLVTDRPSVREHWKALRSAPPSQGAGETTCLVSGKRCVPVDKHPPLKRVPGGTPSGIALVSFNSSAFESYGWRRNDNAPISREAAEACGTALQRLLDASPQDPEGRALPRRNLQIAGDSVICYWAPASPSEEFLTCIGPLLLGDPERVKELFRSIWRGTPPAIDDPSAFYALALSGAQGRAIVRDWFECTVADVAANLAAHFTDLDIVRNTPKPRDRDLPPQIPVRSLLRSLAPQGKDDAVPPPLAAAVVRAALRGTTYPTSILQRAVQRTRAEIGQTQWADIERRDARAALIKAVLNRRKRFFPDTHRHDPEVTKDMDPTNTNQGYLLGRLMAVIERMQQLALGDPNATVVDRFFSGASATPRAVFPRLLKNLRHHASKAKDADQTSGTARWLDGQADEILSKLEDFPAYLDLQQQGLFVVGYHHERHWLWMSKETRQQWQKAHDRPEDGHSA
jgi:CRISPR-associated protein Csd1